MQEKKPRAQKAKIGRPPSGLAPSKKTLIRLYVKEGKAIREIAEALGISKDMVYRGLMVYQIDRRPHTWGPRLEKYDPKFLEELVKKEGFRKGALELGVDKSTLFRYLKRAKI